MLRVRAFAPASMGNVAAGFDTLGAALQPEDGSSWGDVVEAIEAESPSLNCVGPFAHRLPADPSHNLVERARQCTQALLGYDLPPLALTLHKNLPVSSGLGSSSSSAVAAVLAIDAALGGPLGPQGQLGVAAEVEGYASGAEHLDNLAPCLLGGLRLLTPDGRALRLPWPDDLRFVIASQALELPTRQARQVLPKQVSLALAVAHAQNFASFVHALHAADRPLLEATLRDLLVEPYRAALVPGFAQAQKNALNAGALGCSLSGAGPAVFAVATKQHSADVGRALTAGFNSANIACTIRICCVDLRGARLLD